MNKSMDRRTFIGFGTAFAACGCASSRFGFPAITSCRSPNGLLRHACIGTGNMAYADMHSLLSELVERYADVLALGEAAGVRPLLEYWGHSVNLCRVADALQVAAATGNPSAGVLADVYHTYRGGNSFETFRFLSPAVFPVLHVNDYPAEPIASALKDADRVFPGDGIAPWQRIFSILGETGARPWLSLELFNSAYWKSTPFDTARIGLMKVRNICSGGFDGIPVT